MSNFLYENKDEILQREKVPLAQHAAQLNLQLPII